VDPDKFNFEGMSISKVLLASVQQTGPDTMSTTTTTAFSVNINTATFST
jgi:hypothetical protein